MVTRSLGRIREERVSYTSERSWEGLKRGSYCGLEAQQVLGQRHQGSTPGVHSDPMLTLAFPRKSCSLLIQFDGRDTFPHQTASSPVLGSVSLNF